MLSKNILDEARQLRKETILENLENEQLFALWEVAKVSTMFIIVLLFAAAAFNWRSLVFFLSIGDVFSENAAKWISVPLALGIGWALFQQSFRKSLNTLAEKGEPATFGSIFMAWMRDRSLSIAFIMAFGIFGALLFLWGDTVQNEAELSTASSTITETLDEITKLDSDYQADRNRIISQIQFYTGLNLIKLQVQPREVKLEKLKTAYDQKREELNRKLETARKEQGRFRPTSFLSAVIAGVFWKRVIVMVLCAFMLSGTVDLSQYTITIIATSRAYARGAVNHPVMDIYDILVIGNATGATEKATENATEMPQEETAEIQENMIGNATHLSETQSKMLQEIHKMIKTGRGINKNELARILKVDRATIYRNWEQVYKYVSNGNGKLQEEIV